MSQPLKEDLNGLEIEIITNYIEQPHADTNNPSG